MNDTATATPPVRRSAGLARVPGAAPNGAGRPSDVIDLIGNTPLIELKKLGREVAPTRIYAKAEWFNPGGSVKDRPALSMILDGERTGELTRDKVLIDATSGNTGIAYAMICSALGYRARFCVPRNIGKMRERILEGYGADLVFTDPQLATDGAMVEARRLLDESPELYFYPDQYSNSANWKAHYHGTALEILEQTEGSITHFVAGLGTTGTFTGNGKRLRETNPDIRLIAVQPDSPLHGLEGLKHLETTLVPDIFQANLVDEFAPVRTEDAQAMCRTLAREVGTARRAVVGRGGGCGAPDGEEREERHRGRDLPRQRAQVPRHALLDGRRMSVRIAANDMAAIRAHGERAYPHECCGFILGRLDSAAKDAVRLEPAENAREDEAQRNRFLITPDDYRAADRIARAEGLDVLGFYHSHPDAPARPSEYDREHAWPWYSYVIVSVRNQHAEEMTSWELRDDRSAFDEEDVEEKS